MKRWLLFIVCFSFFAPLCGEGTVVLLHGFMRNARSMKPVEDCLRCNGYYVCNWDYPSRDECISGHGENLVCLLKRIAKVRPGQPIHFVSHSVGGLIVRAAVSHPECPQEAKIGRAVMLAPPNQGAGLARHFRNFEPFRWFMGSKTGCQLMTYEPCEVAALGQFPDTMDVMVIAGSRGINLWFRQPNDGKLSVEETRLDTPHEHCTLYVTHSLIMCSPQVLCMTKNFLGEWEEPSLKEEDQHKTEETEEEKAVTLCRSA